jgi:hypothetical protein
LTIFKYYLLQQQFDEDGKVIDSSDDGFQQQQDEDTHGNVLTSEELALTRMNDSHRTPNKQYVKPADKPEEQETPPSPETNRRQLRNQEHETETMKKLSASLTKNTQKQLREQEEKYAMEIAAMKRANMDTQNLITKNTAPAQTMNDHRISAPFTAINKPSEIFFFKTPENWPEFKRQLLTEAENPTIRWNQELINFQTMEETTTPFNFLKGYFDIPENMICVLQDAL